MTYQFLIIIMLSTLGVIQGISQSKNAKDISVRGKVTSFNEKPVQSAQIFIDFVKTSTETNKKGNYKIKLNPDTKLITVYNPAYGYINWDYAGERKVEFVFPEFSEPFSEDAFENLGYTLEIPKRNERNWYSDYSTVLEILDKRFSQVRLNNGQIIVGRGGPNSFNGNNKPLILLDDIPVPVSSLSSISTFDIENIRVIHKGSELAQYGFQGVNGVIHIKLKTGGDKG